MAILVTGGAGFLGSHLCDALLSSGEEVICLDNLNTYYNPIRKIKNIFPNFSNKNFVLVIGDTTKKEDVDHIFNHYSITKVVHLAAMAGVRNSIKDPPLYAKVNVVGTINLLEAAKDKGVKNFIFGSSSSVYGTNDKTPFSESDPVNLQLSPYSATKRAGEICCYTYSRLYPLNITCLRFFTIYGPRGRPDMAPYLFTAGIAEGKTIPLFGDGNSKRDYTYVSDIVQGIMLALEKPFPFEIINLGNATPLSVNELIATIEKKVGKKAKIETLPVQAGDLPITHADISKAQRLLEYNPRINLTEGISNLVDWYYHER